PAATTTAAVCPTIQSAVGHDPTERPDQPGGHEPAIRPTAPAIDAEHQFRADPATTTDVATDDGTGLQLPVEPLLPANDFTGRGPATDHPPLTSHYYPARPAPGPIRARRRSGSHHLPAPPHRSS